MSFYSLTEAYSEIYDPRKVEKIDDNFRFIDYMLDEDIEEVVESLVWEFRDYGYTLDESFDLLTYAASTEVITESYELIIEELLNEANVTFGRGDIAPNQRKAARARARAKVRLSRINGPISSVKSSMSGSKGGMGRASKALGGAVKKGLDIAGGAAQKGKALLGRLLRKGASMVGQAVKSGARQTGRALTTTGRAISASGNKAAAAPVTTRSAKVGRTTYTSTTEPGGSKRQAVGRAVRKVGAALQRKADKKDEPKMTMADYKANYKANKAKRAAAAQAANADAFAAPKPTPSLGFKKLEASGERSKWTPEASNRRARRALNIPALPTPTGKKGQKLSGSARSLRGKSLGKETRAARANLEEILQYIAEDLIEAGYSASIDESYDLIETLDKNTLNEIIFKYIEE